MRNLLVLTVLSLSVAAFAAGGPGTSAEETAAIAPAPGGAPPKAETCLSSADLREEVAEGRVIEPVAAIRAARAAVPRAEIQRASLCRQEAGLVYVLTAVRRNGQFVHVTVDARTGRVAGQD